MSRLYSDVILDHFQSPRNFGSIHAPDISAEEGNPLCGDRIRIEVEVVGGRAVRVCFRGDGCAISIAAASVLTEMIRGWSLEEIAALEDRRLLDALRADIKPTRLACALLPLKVLRNGLAAYHRSMSLRGR